MRVDQDQGAGQYQDADQDPDANRIGLVQFLIIANPLSFDLVELEREVGMHLTGWCWSSQRPRG